ncbi:dienelactone hydrolase family protein [Falsiroseomonas bella]|uniref:dienelactone hydrolase family protein n=1 Tax=Falsiroseomonas bella TaxID=2184016 RepID=UPI001E478C2B|nr:hypothetical protein [Falsiroseomonas bella]
MASRVLEGLRQRLSSSAVALLLFLAAVPASAMHELEHGKAVGVIRPVSLSETAWGLLSLPASMEAEDRVAGILLLGDGESVLDGRSELYAQRLLSLGFGVLDADFDGLVADEGTPAHPNVEPVGRRLGLTLAALDHGAELDPGRVAVIGIGLGARAVLEGWAEHGGALRAAVLVYPGCDAGLIARAPALRPQPGQGRILLVHGDLDEAEAAQCADLVAALGGAERGVARYVLRGADAGWDIDGGELDARSYIPDPANPARRRAAQPDDARAAIALDRMLIFLMGALDPQ